MTLILCWDERFLNCRKEFMIARQKRKNLLLSILARKFSKFKIMIPLKTGTRPLEYPLLHTIQNIRNRMEISFLNQSRRCQSFLWVGPWFNGRWSVI